MFWGWDANVLLDNAFGREYEDEAEAAEADDDLEDRLT